MATPNPSVTHSSRLVHGSPIYYGWIIMLVGALGLIMTSPGQTYAISIFIEHFITDLGLSRSLVSTIYSAASLLASFTLGYFGRQVDRYGSRAAAIVTTLIFGLACLFMGFVSNAWLLGLGFLALRTFGLGGLTLVSTNVINQWWVRQRGMVMGIAGLLMSVLGLAGFPNLINWLIPIYGWQITYMILGLILLLIMLPLAAIFLRDRPEQYGLQPDGDRPLTETGGDSPSPLNEDHWTLSEASRTTAFWVMALGTATIAMLSTGLFFHMVSIFADNSLASTVAATVYVPVAVTTAIVALSSGILVDRLPVKILLAGALLCQAISLVMAPYLYDVALVWLYGVILGTTFGLSRTVLNVVWAVYFGRRHLGSITGVASTIMVIGGSLGPMPFGIGRDLLGSYSLILIISAILPLVLSVITLFVDKPLREM